MSQLNKNQESADNPNRRHSLYLVNIIFMCCLTIVSLVFALVVFFRLRTHGTDGVRQLYTKGQIESIRENAASNARNDLLLEIQSSLESGRSTTQMLREIFDDSIVVVNGGRYYFYPLADAVEKNPLPAGALCQSEGNVLYTGESPSARISHGILLSDNNGKVDWDRLGDSGIEEAAIRVGILDDDRFIRDQQFERNCEKAAAREINIKLCLDIEGTPGEDSMQEALAAVGEMADLYGIRKAAPAGGESEETGAPGEDGAAAATAADAEDASGADDTGKDSGHAPAQGAVDPAFLLRIHSAEVLADDGSDKEAWTKSLRQLCKMIEKKGGDPILGMNLFTGAAQVDLTDLAEYDRWVIDHEETASFPYSYSYWEYSAEGDMEGVPGKAILYARVDIEDSEENSP